MQCKGTWLKRISGTRSNSAAHRALKARITLRNEFKREPYSTEVLKYLTSHPNDKVSYKVVGAAFRAGEEVRPKFVYLCIMF